MLKRILITASKLFPKSYRDSVAENMEYAGMEITAEEWLGESLILGLLVTSAIAFLARYGNPALFYSISIIIFFVYQMGSYSIPYFQAVNRAHTVEESLPNVLQLMAADIRAGMTPFQAIKVSAREEFGILKHELDRATAKAMGTGSFSDALMEVSKRVRSSALGRAIKLFIRSIESGGQLAKVLEETARDISENISLKKELISSTRTYTLLIMVSVLFGAPLLLTISIHFTEKLNELRESLELEQMEGLGLDALMMSTFDPEMLTNISAIIILVTSFIACLLVGVIVEGKERYGLKYAFFMVPLSLIIFYIMRMVSLTVLG